MTDDAERPERPARWFYLDVARIAAILAVVAIHNWSLLHVLTVGTGRWWAVDIILNASRWAVPVFVMISGGLLLGPRPGEKPSTFFRRRLLRVGVPAVFWITAYFLFRAAYLEENLTPSIILTDLALAQPFTQLYFLYVIVGLYLVTPVLRPFTSNATRLQLCLAAGGFLVIAALNALLPYTLAISARSTGLTLWLEFIGFYLAGRALYGLRLTRTASVLIWLAVPLLLACQIGTVYVLAQSGDGSWQQYPQGYFSVFTIGSALLIYVLCAQDTVGQTRSGVMGRGVAALGGATFGVFLVHEMLLYWHARTFVTGTPTELVTLRIPTYFVAVLGSFAIVLVVQRVWGIRRLV